MDKLNKLKNDKQIMTELEALEWEEWERNTIYSDGIKKGIEQGINQNTIEIIKSMLKKELDINLISEITNRSIEEINKIKESL